jgi:hypothetical protein
LIRNVKYECCNVGMLKVVSEGGLGLIGSFGGGESEAAAGPGVLVLLPLEIHFISFKLHRAINPPLHIAVTW